MHYRIIHGNRPSEATTPRTSAASALGAALDLMSEGVTRIIIEGPPGRQITLGDLASDALAEGNLAGSGTRRRATRRKSRP